MKAGLTLEEIRYAKNIEKSQLEKLESDVKQYQLQEEKNKIIENKMRAIQEVKPDVLIGLAIDTGKKLVKASLKGVDGS
jgi:hypothetical protein